MERTGSARALAPAERQTLKQLLSDLLLLVKFPNTEFGEIQIPGSLRVPDVVDVNFARWVVNVRQLQQALAEIRLGNSICVVEFESGQKEIKKCGKGIIEFLRFATPITGKIFEIDYAFYMVPTPTSGEAHVEYLEFLDRLPPATRAQLEGHSVKLLRDGFGELKWRITDDGLEEARIRLVSCLEEWVSWLDEKPKSPAGKKGKAGRKPITELTPHELRIHSAWNSGSYRKYEECDKELKKVPGTTKATIERIRKRQKRATERTK